MVHKCSWAQNDVTKDHLRGGERGSSCAWVLGETIMSKKQTTLVIILLKRVNPQSHCNRAPLSAPSFIFTKKKTKVSRQYHAVWLLFAIGHTPIKKRHGEETSASMPGVRFYRSHRQNNMTIGNRRSHHRLIRYIRNLCWMDCTWQTVTPSAALSTTLSRWMDG